MPNFLPRIDGILISNKQGYGDESRKSNLASPHHGRAICQQRHCEALDQGRQDSEARYCNNGSHCWVVQVNIGKSWN